jgi:uncharacterized protein YbjT (DUF2867 family)
MSARRKIAVAGATGRAGHHVVDLLTERGHDVVRMSRGGVGRVVVVSIIATDRLKGGYGVAKAAHEQATLSGPIPARVLRAAQFHEFVEQLVQWGTQGDVSSVPKMRTQLVAARTSAVG